MRLVKVAKALGMTGQELRHELEKVDFGVKSTDREVPDNLAQGILRFFARQKGIEIDMAALGLGSATEHLEEEGQQEEQEEQEEQVEEKEETEQVQTLNVLRKLTLEDVSEKQIAVEAKKLEGTSTRKKRQPAKKEPEKKKEAATHHQEQIKVKEGTVVIPAELTVKEFAEKVGVQVPKVVSVLMQNGIMATITQNIDYDTAAIVAGELGVTVQKEVEIASAEHLFARNLEDFLQDEPEHLKERPPIVVIMGHVDHGKTSILDAVRDTDVVSGEAGGITQHIGAYQVEVELGDKEHHVITFLDTPGHEAFTAMRARGAQVTDIAIIVVAADEGIKPTTKEAIHHAKEANIPIIVALNKMDKEGADPDRVKGELAAEGLQPEDWGGKVPTVNCSAKSKLGIDELLETIVLTSQITEFKGNPDRDAVATVIESHLDPSLGPLATVVVNTGTLNTGDIFVCGETQGRVRAMMDARGRRLDDIGPSGPVRLTGFSDVPALGDILQVVPSEQKARELVDAVREHGAHSKKRSFADLVSRLSEGKLKQLKIVLKADTQGSLDAISDALSKVATDEVMPKIIHDGVGSVSESDVMMAAASDGVVIAFHTSVPAGVSRTAEREGVEVRPYDVIYALLDDIEGLLNGLVEPEEEEQILGHLEVRGVFHTKKKEQIIGGRVTDGTVKKLSYRLMRGEEQVGEGRITSLKKVDKDAKEVTEGNDCGMRVEISTPIEEGDVLEVYLRELKKKA